MKGHYGVKSAIVIVLVVVITCLCIFGAEPLNISNIKNMRLGIDIRGGVSAILYPDVEEGTDVTAEQLEEAKRIIDLRLEGQGITDKYVYVDTTYMRIQVEIPWAVGDTDMNPQKTVEDIGSTAILSFQDVSEEEMNSDGTYTSKDENIIFTGEHILSAVAHPASEGNRPYVYLELDDEGKEIFAEATTRLVNKKIAIFMDDLFISAPAVNEPITGGTAQISMAKYGEEALQSAKELASTIRAGALPFKMEVKSLNSISATLGEGALKIMIYALLAALVLIVLIMIVRYRLPGLIAGFGLYALLAALMLVMLIGSFSITLPGIAGIILTIGMGVDGNVVIFERIKEEMIIGKTRKAAVEAGFKRAFAAIFDGNVTTIIVAIVLLVLGSGPIKGFATTLLAGVIISFLTAVTASKALLGVVAGKVKNPWLFGVSKKQMEAAKGESK